MKNLCTACDYFCLAAPGIVLVYEDANAPQIEYWINEGTDLLIGGRRVDGGYLAWWECINNATFPASAETGEVVNATLGVVAPWGDGAPDDILFFNGVELGRGVYNGYSSPYSKTIDSLSMEIGASNAQLGMNITYVTAHYLKGSANMVGQADNGDCMMPANAFLVVEYKEEKPKPDLEIVDKYEAWINDTHYNVTYVIHNNGTAVAPAGHNTTLYVDDAPIEDKLVPVNLAPCQNYTDTFDTVIEYTGESDTIRVCADNYDVVDELNETNNCVENVWLRAMPEISVNKVAKPIAGPPSINVTFTITVTNTGDCTLNPVKVVDTLPVGMSYVSSSPAGSRAGNTITWYVGPLASGNSTTISLVAHIDEGAAGMLTNSVTVTGTSPERIDVHDCDSAEIEVLARTIEPPQQTLLDITTEIMSDGIVIEEEQFGWEAGNGNLLNNPPLAPGEAVGSIKYDEKMISSNGTTEFEKCAGVNSNVTPNLAVSKDIGYKSANLDSLSHAEQVGMRYSGTEVNAYSAMVVTEVGATTETKVGRELLYETDAKGKGSVSVGVDISVADDCIDITYSDKSKAYGGNFSFEKKVGYTSKPP